MMWRLLLFILVVASCVREVVLDPQPDGGFLPDAPLARDSTGSDSGSGFPDGFLPDAPVFDAGVGAD